jgi:hypothetical protein
MPFGVTQNSIEQASNRGFYFFWLSPLFVGHR